MLNTVGVRELKNSLSRHVREVERGKRIAVTAHGRVVAELVPPQRRSKKPKRLSRWEQMIADGHIHPPVEDGDPIEDDGVEIRLPPGSSLEWLDWSRGEDHEE